MDTVKVTVNLPVRVWSVLEQMASRRGVTRTEMLRRAISSEKARQDTEDRGGEHLVKYPDGTMERVVFPY